MIATRFSPVSTTNGFLSEEMLRKSVPSIFAGAAHESRSERYTYVPTIDIVRGLSREGFFPVQAGQSTPRDEGKIGHTKHMLRFRRANDIQRVSGLTTRENHFINRAAPLAEFPEVVLINSHDGSSAYQLMAGIFRLVCTNGLIIGNAVEECKVRHSGNIIELVIEAAFTIARSFERSLESAERMKSVKLSRPEALILAEGAAELRFELEPGDAAPIAPEKFLAVRRQADQADDLWRTFNRIQENAIRGGLRGVIRNERGQRRLTRTREVKGIDQNVRLNRALWTMAEKMAELKA